MVCSAAYVTVGGIFSDPLYFYTCHWLAQHVYFYA